MGRHRYRNSYTITLKPQPDRMFLMESGETGIGVHGKKYRVLSKGDKRAIPYPPFVNASRIP